MKKIITFLALLIFTLAANAQTTLINDVRIFNGVDEDLRTGNILVVDGMIETISSSAIDAPEGATVIEGGGRILTPGFIDLHVHFSIQSPGGLRGTHASALGAYAVNAGRYFLDHGFTTVRDAGGTHPDLAKAFNSGEVYGPRLFPSGAIVSQTSGHGDWRHRLEPNPVHDGSSPFMDGDASMLADGVDATLVAVRENLKNGATQIKIMGGGGVMSDFDPIHTLQPSPAEIRAAVQAASDWGTYVMAHAYTAEAITRLIENGVMSIEHGLLIDDAAARLVAEKNAVISTQLMIFRHPPFGENMTEENKRKMAQVQAGQENMIRLIQKYDILTGFSTDFIFGQYHQLAQEFTERALFWSNVEVLRQATSQGGEVIRMAGKLNRHGDFGEIREGWVADMLIFDGELMEDLSLIGDPENNLRMIMKGGELVKDTLQ